MAGCLWRDLTPSGRRAFVSELKNFHGIFPIEPVNWSALEPPVFVTQSDERVYPMGCAPSVPPIPGVKPTPPAMTTTDLFIAAGGDPLFVDVTEGNVVYPFPWLAILAIGAVSVFVLTR